MIKALYKSLGEQVFTILRKKIVDNELQPGTILQIDRLAEEFGVSTTPIREALMKLEALGLVTISPNRRATVSPISREQTREVLEFRRMLESAGARSAAKKLSDRDIDYLITRVQSVQAAPSDVPHHIEVDMELHDKYLFGCIENGFVRKALEDLQVHLRRIRFYAEEALDPVKVITSVCEEHMIILNALKSRNETAAELGMYGHLTQTLVRTLLSMDKKENF